MSTEQLAILRAEIVSDDHEHCAALLRQVITEHGGMEINDVLTGVMVVFASASAALGCAVAMQQGVERDNRQDLRTAELRIGVSAGDVTRNGEGTSGDCVTEAVGLSACAGAGQILAADVVRLMAGRRNTHECRSIDALEVAGLPEPIEAVEVVWPRLEAADVSSRIPLPARLTLPTSNFVGRNDELGLIEDTWSRVSAGPAREIVLVSGEAGLGKTSLVVRAAREAFERGANILFGHCEEDLAAPYQLFAETLRHFVIHAPEPLLRAHVAIYGSELVRIVPDLAGRIPDLPPTKATDADSERSLLFAAVVGMLAAAADERPLVLLFDDIQWADKGSLLLLRHLATVDRPMRLMVLATFRDNEVSTLLDTLAALHRRTGVKRLDLKGLDDHEVLACVSAIVGETADDLAIQIAQIVRGETDGNPFFVGELLRHLKESGAISKEGQWVATTAVAALPMPDSLREVVVARVSRLDPECARVLGLAAVIGRDFDFDLLARVASLPEDALLDLLDQAEEAALIQELPGDAGRYHFAHALIQHVLYQEFSAARRVVAHRGVANALEDLCGHRPGLRIAELARHWAYAPQRGDAAKAVGYAYQAGNAALSALAPADAIDYFVSARSLISAHAVTDDALEIDVAVCLGTAQRQTGDPAFRDTLLNAAKLAVQIDDTPRLVRAALANDRGWHSTSGAIDTEKVAQLELALERLPAGVAERALVLSALCAELAFGSTLAHRLALADEALAIAEATGDDAIIVRTLNQRAFSLTVPSLLDSSLLWTADALSRAERLGDPMQLYFAAMYRATAAVRANNIAEADRCFAIAGPLVRQLDLPPLRWEYTFHMSKRAQIEGDLAKAEQLAGEAVSIGTESGQPDAQMCYGVQLAAINWMRGTLGALTPLLEAMMAANPGLPTIRASLAMAYAQAERYDDAKRLLKEFAATNYLLPQDTVWLNGMTEYADAAIACGDRRFAGALYDILTPWADQFASAGGLTAEGPICLYLGGLATVLKSYDEAEAHLLQAAEICARNEMRFFAARAALWQARLFVARGQAHDAEAARALLISARDEAAAHDYGAIEHEADVALAQLTVA